MKTQRLRRPPNRLAILLSISLATAVSLPAITPSEWRYEQTIEVGKAGLVRVPLPPATLDAARPGLDDLRILDPEGNETPLLLERPMPSAESTEPAVHLESELRAEATTLTVTTSATAPLVGVTLATPATDFIKSARVEGSYDKSDWQELAAGQMIFRQRNGAEKLRIDFPARAWKFLRITIDDARSKPVPFTDAQTHTPQAEAQQAPALVTIKSRDEIDGATRLTLDLGAANLTLASLTFETPEPLFTRRLSVAVREVAEDGIREVAVGAGVIYRVALDGKSDERLTLALDKPIPSRELIVFIRNDDSPPLAVSGVKAERRLSRVVFFASAPGRFRLLTGNAECRAPSYDVSTLSAQLNTAPAGAAAPSALTENAGFKSPEALAALTLEGGPIDPADWRFRSALDLARPGAQELELNLDALAHAQSDQRDLRLIRDGRQLPFLLEHTSISRALLVGATAANDPKQPAVSRWSLKLPKPALPVTHLVCASGTPLFQREIRVWEETTDERGEKIPRELGHASWKRTPQDASHELFVGLTQTPVTDTLLVETDNGDNPPIELRDFRCGYAATRLVFKASPDAAKPLWLYYGNPSASAPRYDLSLVAHELLRAEKSPVKLGPEEALKATTSPTAETLSQHGSWILWGALAVVVVGLLALIARLLPKTNG